jgi:hypothetical protein
MFGSFRPAALRLHVDAAISALVNERHLLERLRGRSAEAAPGPVSGHPQQLLERADLEAHVGVSHGQTLGRAGVPDDDHVSGLLGQHEVGLVLDAALARLTVMLGHAQDGRLLFGDLDAAVGPNVEGRLHGDEPDLGPISIAHPATVGSKGGVVVDLPHVVVGYENGRLPVRAGTAGARPAGRRGQPAHPSS